MTEEQNTAPQGAFDLFTWCGALVISVALGVVLSAAWLWFLLALDDLLPIAEDGGLDDISGVPIRSLKLGLLAGIVLSIEVLHRILRKEKTQIGVTLTLTLILTVASALTSYINEYVRLQVLSATLVVVALSALHIVGTVVVQVCPRLVKSTLPGMATALSLASFIPVCEYAAVGDDLASSAEPTAKLDGADVVALIEEKVEESCYDRVAKWRSEAVAEAERLGGLPRADAENFVTSVIISVCKDNTPRIDLHTYFFKSVRRRTADPWRQAKRELRLNAPQLPATEGSDPLKEVVNLAAVPSSTRCWPPSRSPAGLAWPSRRC